MWNWSLRQIQMGCYDCMQGHITTWIMWGVDMFIQLSVRLWILSLCPQILLWWSSVSGSLNLTVPNIFLLSLTSYSLIIDFTMATAELQRRQQWRDHCSPWWRPVALEPVGPAPPRSGVVTIRCYAPTSRLSLLPGTVSCRVLLCSCHVCCCRLHLRKYTCLGHISYHLLSLNRWCDQEGHKYMIYRQQSFIQQTVAKISVVWGGSVGPFKVDSLCSLKWVINPWQEVCFGTEKSSTQRVCTSHVH